MTLAERYRRLCNRRGQDAWSILFGYPVARLLLVWLESWRWLRPTHLTIASILTRAAGAALLLGSSAAILALAVFLLQLGQVLDSMDGTLARARGQHSSSGAFLDKVGDALVLGLLCAALGVQAVAVDGRPVWMAAALGGAFLHLLRGYMHWVAHALAAGAPTEPLNGARAEADRPRPLREWAAGIPRLVLFNEADLYVWISLGALVGRWREACALVLVSQAAAALGLAAAHLARLSASESARVRCGPCR